MTIYDDPLVTYDGAPTDATFNQMNDRITEVWGRLGLDWSAPLAQTETRIEFGAVRMVVSENDTTVTVTRT